jgi:hypothetical protein
VQRGHVSGQLHESLPKMRMHVRLEPEVHAMFGNLAQTRREVVQSGKKVTLTTSCQTPPALSRMLHAPSISVEIYTFHTD